MARNGPVDSVGVRGSPTESHGIGYSFQNLCVSVGHYSMESLEIFRWSPPESRGIPQSLEEFQMFDGFHKSKSRWA